MVDVLAQPMHAGGNMFIGHYGPAFAIKRWRPALPLGVLFMAAQLVDVAWGVFVPLGVEKVRIVPGITKTNPLDLYYMPYTHSLLGASLWALSAAAVYAGLRNRERFWQLAPPLALAVFSHWLLDLLVHRPDLPLYGDIYKMGFGLWNYPAIALVLEVGSLLGGIALWVSCSRARDALGKFGPWVFAALLCAVQVVMFFGKPPKTPNQAAVAALVSYALFAACAVWLDHHRISESKPRARAYAAHDPGQA